MPMDVQSHKVNFVIENAGMDVEGSFSKMTANIEFDAEDLPGSVLTASVDVASIKTGIELRDRHLLGREYFYAEKFPSVKMESKSIRSAGKNKYIGVFAITIRDISKEVEIPFSASNKGRNLVLKADFSINRLDFSIGTSSIILSNAVAVHLELVAQPKR